MGLIVGSIVVGLAEGAGVGLGVGFGVGFTVGFELGFDVGVLDGLEDGNLVGFRDARNVVGPGVGVWEVDPFGDLGLENVRLQQIRLAFLRASERPQTPASPQSPSRLHSFLESLVPGANANDSIKIMMTLDRIMTKVDSR